MGLHEDQKKILVASAHHYHVDDRCNDCFFQWFSRSAVYLFHLLKWLCQKLFWEYRHIIMTAPPPSWWMVKLWPLHMKNASRGKNKTSLFPCTRSNMCSMRLASPMMTSPPLLSTTSHT